MIQYIFYVCEKNRDLDGSPPPGLLCSYVHDDRKKEKREKKKNTSGHIKIHLAHPHKTKQEQTLRTRTGNK